MLKYIGNGFIVDIPARDLAEEEVRRLALQRNDPKLKGHLVASGLYQAKLERPKRADKALRPQSEDKEYEED